MHIRQEGHSPEGGKLSRLIKREMIDAPAEQDTEDDAMNNVVVEYPESHSGQDSGPEEDMAEDLSMAPEIPPPEDHSDA